MDAAVLVQHGDRRIGVRKLKEHESKKLMKTVNADASAHSQEKTATTYAVRNARFDAGFLLERLRSSVVEVFQVLMGTPVAIMDVDVEPASFDRTAIVGLAGTMCGVVEFLLPGGNS